MFSKFCNILWDIDGTLLNTNGAGVTPFEKSLSDVIGSEVSLDRKNFSGFTDFEIVEKLVETAGCTDLNLDQFIEFKSKYSLRIQSALKINPAKSVEPARKFLETFNNNHKIRNFIGTGNINECAIHKLDSAGILGYFDNKDMYCCDFEHKDRYSIILKAKNVINVNLLIVGDSPRDIEVAKKLSIPVVAVATGQHSYEELNLLNPDHTLESNYSSLSLLNAIEDIMQVKYSVKL